MILQSYHRERLDRIRKTASEIHSLEALHIVVVELLDLLIEIDGDNQRRNT